VKFDDQEEGDSMVVHRKFSPELKARVVLELISGSSSLAEVCRQYNLKPQTS
jgi:transposase-like protein